MRILAVCARAGIFLRLRAHGSTQGRFLLSTNPLLTLLRESSFLICSALSLMWFLISIPSRIPPAEEASRWNSRVFFFITTVELPLNLKWINQLTPGCILDVIRAGLQTFQSLASKATSSGPRGRTLVPSVHSSAFPLASVRVLLLSSLLGLCLPGIH